MSDQNNNNFYRTRPSARLLEYSLSATGASNTVDDDSAFLTQTPPPPGGAPLYSNWSTTIPPPPSGRYFQQYTIRNNNNAGQWPLSSYPPVLFNNVYVNPSNYDRFQQRAPPTPPEQLQPPSFANFVSAPPPSAQWESLYTPFGMVKAPPVEQQPPGRLQQQRTSMTSSPTDAAAVAYANNELTSSSTDASASSPVLTPKGGVSYRDVASKPPLHNSNSVGFVGGRRMDSSPPLSTRHDASYFGKVAATQPPPRLRKHSLPSHAAAVGASRQSSSDSLSENFVVVASPNIASVNSDDSESEEKSVNSVPVKTRLDPHAVVSNVRKLENILRKSDDNRSAANAFKKHATTATMTTAVAGRASVGGDFQKIVRRKGKSTGGSSSQSGDAQSQPTLPIGGDRFGVLTSASKKDKGAAAALNISISRSTKEVGQPKLNNERCGKFYAASKSPTHKSAASYINNDLTSTRVNDEDAGVATSSGDEEEADSTYDCSLDGDNKNADAYSASSKNASGKSAATKIGGKKTKRADSDLTDRYGKRKKKRENALYAWFAYAFVVIAQHVQHAFVWLINLVTDIGTQLADVVVHCAKLCSCKICASALLFWYKTCEHSRNAFLKLRQKEWSLLFWWKNRKKRSGEEFGLEKNIDLPNTGEEAMKRLLMCRGQDAYSILGLKPDCTDEDIKRYYRRQAVLVHPDKNTSYCADEAFKILAAAFELIGTPEHRSRYDLENLHRTKAMKEMEEMFAKLREKMEEVRSTMHCDCGKKHKRFPTDRCLTTARFCQKCKDTHAAREGDIWAESHWLGFLWYYYACMEGIIYDITEWAGCSKNNLKHIKPNAHLIQYRLITGRNARRSQPSDGKGLSDADAEEFLNRLLEEKLNSTSSASGGQADFGQQSNASTAPAQSKFRPPSCPGDSRPRKAGRRRNKARL